MFCNLPDSATLLLKTGHMTLPVLQAIKFYLDGELVTRKYLCVFRMAPCFKQYILGGVEEADGEKQRCTWEIVDKNDPRRSRL